jgi:hypothetical protein
MAIVFQLGSGCPTPVSQASSKEKGLGYIARAPSSPSVFLIVIARAEGPRQSRVGRAALDCFARLEAGLAMTGMA